MAAEVFFRHRALGIRVEADRPLRAMLGDGEAAGRLAVTMVERLPSLPAEGMDRLGERRDPSGALALAIDWHPGAGYLIQAPGYGSHLLAADGREVTSVPPADDDWPWHRLFFAQVLPAAAALQGLEVLHASSIAMEGQAVAVISASGGGKSSLAARLVAGGGRFVTDDVLALELAPDALMAHPGPALMALDEAELNHVERLGPELFRSDKVHVGIEPVFEALPLGRLIFLERGGPGREIALQRLSPPDPRRLLASTFVSHLATRERLERQLETCAELARRVPCYRLSVPPGQTAASTVAVLLAHR